MISYHYVNVTVIQMANLVNTMNVKNKTKAIKDFFETYAHDINGELNLMNSADLKEYLENDVFIACASAATGINEPEFISWAMDNVGKL